MEGNIQFTKEALEKLTPEQNRKICRLAETAAVSVFVDFSLPQDYVAVRYRHSGNEMYLYGGINGNGEMST